MVDPDLLAIWRDLSSDREYRREVLAEWVDAQGAYFSDDEIEAALADYELIPPERAERRRGVAGIDWGLRVDSSAVVVLAEAGPGDLSDEWPPHTFWVPWVDEGVHVGYGEFVRRVVDVAKGYRWRRIASECNGVGQMPTTELARLLRFHHGKVVAVTKTATSKVDGFGRLRLLLSQGRLALPRHPALLAQLSALEYEERDSGTLKIHVPERQGHDDIAMALMLGVSEADVASVPSSLTLQIPEGDLRTAPIGRPYVPLHEPPVPVVRDGQPRPADALVEFRYAKRHPIYRPPGPVELRAL